MKTTIYLFLAVLPFGLSAQNDKTDTTKISMGSKVIVIYKDSTEASKPKHKSFKKEKHWAGFELGINGLFTPDFGINSNPNHRYMDMDYSKNVAIHLNLAEYNQPLIKDKLFLTTGLGFRFNRYGFKNNTNLAYDIDQVFGQEDSTKIFSKNVLKASYLSVPLFIKLMPGKTAKKSFHFSAGAIGHYRMGSRIKQKYDIGGNTFKDVVKGHYHLNPFLFDASVRFGVGNFTVFANYGLNSLFERNKGPELYPFTVGVRLIGF